MWPFNRYPYTSYTNINLDWIMHKLKEQISGLVASVNGKTGNVVLDASDVHALPDTYTPPAAPVQSVNTQTGDVVIPVTPAGGTTGQVLAKDSNTDYDYSWQNVAAGGAVDSVNGQTGTVVLDANDVGALPDTYTAPVSSVNGQTGTVVLDANDVGALPDTYTAPVSSVNGQTGAVILTAANVGALGIQRAADAISTGTQYNLNNDIYTEFVVIICSTNGANHNTIYYIDAANNMLRLLGNVASGITPTVSGGYLTLVSTQTAHVWICPLPPV